MKYDWKEHRHNIKTKAHVFKIPNTINAICEENSESSSVQVIL